MNRRLVTLTLCLIAFSLAGLAFPKDKAGKPGTLTGTWDCVSHGGSRGDLEFTLTLEQDKDTVTGNVTSPIGSSELTNATYKDKTLEIHIEGAQSEYVITGKFKDGKLSGEWSHGDEKGTWEGNKEAPTKK